MAIGICTCPNKGQDELHGKQRRVCNPTISKPPTWVCTVCKKEITSERIVKR